jgi:hypothetical protein
MPTQWLLLPPSTKDLNWSTGKQLANKHKPIDIFLIQLNPFGKFLSTSILSIHFNLFNPIQSF